MAKVMNVVFGIGIGIVIYVLILLGIQAFYPEESVENYCGTDFNNDPMMAFAKCPDDITVGECRKTIDIKQNQECQDKFMDAMKIYNKNFFIIASILGLITVIVGYFITLANISAGVVCSGIVMVMWAFIRGWESTEYKLKFIIGLIVSAIIILLGVKVNKKLEKKKRKK